VRPSKPAFPGFISPIVGSRGARVSPEFVHRFVPGRTPGGPVLLLLHGTGGDETDLLPLGEALAFGAALLSPRGRVLERGMPRFFRRLAEGVFDVPDLIERTRELAEFVDAASAEYGFDPAAVIAAGYSNGANIAACLLLMHPGVLRGAILFRAMVPLVPETRPRLAGIPVFIAAGRQDPIVPYGQTQQLAGLLEEAGADVTVHVEPGGHALTEGDVTAARAWLAERLSRGTAPPGRRAAP
jgi:phospholipase/carboxylesterase